MINVGIQIKQFRKEKGLKRQQVALKAKIGVDYLGKIERGERSPNLGVLGRIANALDVKLIDLLSITPSFAEHGVPFPIDDWGLHKLGEARPVPRIGWAKAGSWDEASDSGFEPGDADEWIYSDCRGPNVFALRVNGDSMLPEFEDGEVIVVDPSRKPESGDYVVAGLSGDNEATFKQLKISGKKTILHALNPAYPDIELGPELPAGIVGVVVEKKTFFEVGDLRDSKLGAIMERVKNLEPADLDRVIGAIDLIFPPAKRKATK